MGWSRDYWLKHREALAEKRRERYHNDPEYKKRALQRSAEYRERKRQEREEEEAQRLLEVNGKEVPAFTINELLEQVGISKGRFKYMQRVDFVPKALVTHPIRLYTANQIAFVKRLDDFLKEYGTYIRFPESENGKVATAKLHELLSTINENWES